NEHNKTRLVVWGLGAVVRRAALAPVVRRAALAPVVRRAALAAVVGWSALAAVGCKPKSIVLGNGELDSGTATTSFDTDSAIPASPSTSGDTDVSRLVPDPTRPAETSFVPPDDAGSESIDERSGSLREAGTEPSGDMCEQAYATCKESKAPESVCMTVLIDCRTSLPDGGPPCQDVFTRCVELGYPEQDCDEAATVCAEGGDYQLLPLVDSALWIDDTSSR